MGLTRAEAERLGIGHLHPGDRPEGKASGRPPHERFRMNRTESRFAEHLEGLRLSGEILSWEFETDTFILSPDMRYTPDFRVEREGEPSSLYDVKGRHSWEDSIVKGKAAAALYPWHRFYLARWEPPKLLKAGLRPGRWAMRRLGVARGDAS